MESIYRDELESEDDEEFAYDESLGWEEQSGKKMPTATKKAVRRALNAIPSADLLGVMSCDIDPKDGGTCLVCRLFDPEKGFSFFSMEYDHVSSVEPVAERYEVEVADMDELYTAAANYTAEVERMIAARLNRIVRV